MTAQGHVNHWRAEAAHLPPAQVEGEWCVSPGGLTFQVLATQNADGMQLAWHLCVFPLSYGRGVPTEISFKPTLFPPP